MKTQPSSNRPKVFQEPVVPEKPPAPFKDEECGSGIAFGLDWEALFRNYSGMIRAVLDVFVDSQLRNDFRECYLQADD